MFRDFMTTACAESSISLNADPMPYGMPDERLARMAARRAFVEMKSSFMRAVAQIEGQAGATLQRKVRLSGEVVELWRLRHAVLGALPRDTVESIYMRQELMHQLDSAFPEGGGPTAFVPL